MRRRIISRVASSWARISAAQFRITRLRAESGSFAITGTDAALRLISGKVLGAGAGAFAITGQAATLLRAKKLAAAAGSFAITGQAASLNRGKRLAAAAGSFAITGTAATLLKSKKLAAAAGAFSITGTAATLTKSSTVATRTFVTTFNDETDATSYTASGVSLSTADATRGIVVAVMNRISSGTGTTPASVTIGGVSASLVVAQATASDRDCCSLWIAAVPTGATGNIVVDFGGVTQQRCGFGWWATYNLNSLTAVDTAQSDVSGASIDVDTQAGGLAFGAGAAGTTASTTFTWTGLTEDYDAAVGSGNGWHTGASLETAAASTPLAITCTGSGTPGGDQYVAASFR